MAVYHAESPIFAPFFPVGFTVNGIQRSFRIVFGALFRHRRSRSLRHGRAGRRRFFRRRIPRTAPGGDEQRRLEQQPGRHTEQKLAYDVRRRQEGCKNKMTPKLRASSPTRFTKLPIPITGASDSEA